MIEVDVTANFGLAPGDWTTLSKGSRRTIEALYQYPLSHNLEWSGVVALFEKLGTVDHKSHNELAFRIGGERHTVVVGHGAGRSNAAHQFIEFLHQRHAVLASKVVCEVVADLSSLTAPQLLNLGRRALTAELPSSIERTTS